MPNQTDRSAYQLLPGLPGIGILRADYRRHRFRTHAHDCYTLGIIFGGRGGFRYRGKEHLTRGGHVTLLDPHEPHGGHVAGDRGWQYNTLYIPAEYLHEIADGLTGPRPASIHFGKIPALDDPEIYRLLTRFHALARENDHVPAAEPLLQEVLALVLTRYAETPFHLPVPGSDSRAVEQIRDYIRSMYPEKIQLSDLGEIVQCSKFRVIRMFQKQMGMSPHDYLNQVRIETACRLLKKGISIAEAALSTGFYDQSHMSRTFKSLVGVTPGQFLAACNILQDTP